MIEQLGYEKNGRVKSLFSNKCKFCIAIIKNIISRYKCFAETKLKIGFPFSLILRFINTFLPTYCTTFQLNIPPFRIPPALYMFD